MPYNSVGIYPVSPGSHLLPSFVLSHRLDTNPRSPNRYLQCSIVGTCQMGKRRFILLFVSTVLRSPPNCSQLVLIRRCRTPLGGTLSRSHFCSTDPNPCLSKSFGTTDPPPFTSGAAVFPMFSLPSTAFGISTWRSTSSSKAPSFLHSSSPVLSLPILTRSGNEGPRSALIPPSLATRGSK